MRLSFLGFDRMVVQLNDVMACTLTLAIGGSRKNSARNRFSVPLRTLTRARAFRGCGTVESTHDALFQIRQHGRGQPRNPRCDRRREQRRRRSLTARTAGPDSLDAVFGEFFGTQVRVFAVSSGTAANALSLATLCPPWGTVLTHAEAHIERDECGAPEFFTGGAKLSLVGGEGAKITPADLEARLDVVRSARARRAAARVVDHAGHGARRGVLRRRDRARSRRSLMTHDMSVHMDGARFANALVAQNVLARGAHVESGRGCVVLRRHQEWRHECRGRGVLRSRPRGGFRVPPQARGPARLQGTIRRGAALAYLETGIWKRNAESANRLAARIAAAAPELPQRALRDQPGVHEARRRAGSRPCRGSSAFMPGRRGFGRGALRVLVGYARRDVDALCAALS